MNFEEKLKEVTGEYQRLSSANPIPQDQITSLLRESFQARNIRFEETHTTATITAPSLYLHYGKTSPFKPEATAYIARQGKEQLPPENNGFLELSFIHEDQREQARIF